jgi:hypothetical protein
MRLFIFVGIHKRIYVYMRMYECICVFVLYLCVCVCVCIHKLISGISEAFYRHNLKTSNINSAEKFVINMLR